MENLRSIAVQTVQQVEEMRLIYNENLDYLATKPLPYREYEDQQNWWNTNKESLKAFLYEPIDRLGVTIGFLVLRQRSGFQTPIIALKREEWGSGYGMQLVYDYIDKADGPLAGSQLKSNKAICHINKKVGWKVLEERETAEGVIELVYHPGKAPDRKVQDVVSDAICSYLEIQPRDLNHL